MEDDFKIETFYKIATFWIENNEQFLLQKIVSFFPKFAKLSCRAINIPSMNASSAREFSKAVRILVKRRTCLQPSKVDQTANFNFFIYYTAQDCVLSSEL